VFVYLKHKDKRICYYKTNILDYTNPNPEIQWVEMEPDLAIGDVKEHYKAGIVGFKMSIHD
jgi:hypothetical protein